MVKYNTILRAIDEYIKCARDNPTSTSGIIYPKGEAPKFEPKGRKLTSKELNEIADTMAERYGLEVSVVNGKREINGKKFILWDNEHNTEINLSTLIQYQDEVDFTNRGYYNNPNGGAYSSTYTLDEVLSYYNEMPELMKRAVGGIIFRGSGSAYHTSVDGRVNNPVVITHNFLRSTDWYSPRDGNDNLQRVLYHEISHALENPLNSEEFDVLRKANIGKGEYAMSKLTTEREREIYNNLFPKGSYAKSPHKYVFSDTVNYDNGMAGNDKKFASTYGRDFYLDTSPFAQNHRCEDFAETMSMVAMSRTGNKENVSLDSMGSDDFKKSHSETWKYCEDILDGKIDYNDLKRYHI